MLYQGKALLDVVWTMLNILLISKIASPKITIRCHVLLLSETEIPSLSSLHYPPKNQIYFLIEFIASEYNRVPRIAMELPIIEPVLIGVLNAITLATIMTTLLIVFPTA